MNREAVKVFLVQKNIFGISPCCQQFFRLSDYRVFLRNSPSRSWLGSTDTRADHTSRSARRCPGSDGGTASGRPRRWPTKGSTRHPEG